VTAPGTQTLDLTGVVCPLNWVKAKLALEELAPGDELTLLLDPGEPLDSVPRSALEDGHNVRVEGTRVTIVKRG
jgi:tRNA 2-thiouridine synthesizing protein A